MTFAPTATLKLIADHGYDDFIVRGFIGSDGVLHAKTRLGTLVHVPVKGRE